MNRGSEWRIWDLHVHTPLSIENNYGCANDEEGWNKYITALEQLPSDIKVLGINDYLFIDGYKKVKEYKDSGRLSNIELLLPVVEFRLAKFCGHKQFKRINFHVIFSNEVSADVIQYQFLNALSSNYTLSTDCTQQWGGVVTMENLEDLGCRIINSVPEEQKHNYGSPLKEGFNNLNLELSQIITILNNAPQYFKGKYLTAIGKTEWDEFKWDDTSIAEKKTIINQADIVFTAAENIEKFNNAKVKLQEQNVNSLLLDCSDAHSFADTSTKDRLGNCKTWIKADPTFEGLKQIIFEPEDRVRICDSKPEYKYDYDVIDRVELNSANTWHQTIYLNQNLNSIIGGRSTGKSTLLASLAASFNCIDDVDNKEYINQLRDSVHIYWRDGQENGDKYIEYFPQNKISKVAEPQETDKLLMDILLGKEDVKVEYDKHKSLLASRFSTIQANVALYFEKRRLYIEKKQYIKGIGDDKGIKIEIAKLEKQRNEYQSKLTDKSEVLNVYIKDAEEIRKKQMTKSLLFKESEMLKLHQQDCFVVINNSINISYLTSEHSSELSQIIKSAIEKANTEVQGTITQILAKNTQSILKIDGQIAEIQSKDVYKEGKQIFEANKSLTDIIKQLDELNKKLALITRETETSQKLHEEFKEIGNNLLSMHISYLDAMNDIAFKMRLQYEDVLLTSAIVLKPTLNQALSECISLRSAAMNELIDNVVKGFNKRTKADIEECLRNILNKALRNEIPFKAGYDAQSFMSRILSENWFGLSLNVEYDGDNLKDMSPGKRSFVVLKLLLDFSDKRSPILIDQPEDNLDNRAIYTDLVKYIRKKKKERQIILVTHNPNIVVGADSEEVIIANQNGKNSPNDNGIKFQYLCGSLENSKDRINDETMPILDRCGVREHVCDILEGGKNAFMDREHKYGFYKI
ncbi:TrlF family AAA-like ATPase [Bacteroides faecis]|uniref:TrlF family AAA-like ATPase n=1 Tax=Bacteroides faecis TaxID=674529 RepID=UPI0034A47F49